MNPLLNSLFGPLNKEYCFLFYVYSVIAFLMIIAVIFGWFVAAVNKGGFLKGLEKMITTWTVLPSLIMLGMMYLQNRLLFNMCNKSL